MFKQPDGRNVRAVERAIALRATGHTWEQVRKLVNRKIETVREWPRKYPEFWFRRLTAAHQELDRETIGEARSLLRYHMRNPNLKDGRDCARILLDHARRSLPPAAADPPPAATPTSEFHQIADYLEGLSDDDRQALLEAESVVEPEWKADEGLLPPGLARLEDGPQ
jgi:hypothetical protein